MKFKALYLFAGIGGGALGFQQAREEWKGVVGTVETMAGIDCDPEACEDFELITGSPAIQMDLFSRQQYIDFHGVEPPEDWQEVTPFELWQAVGGEYPDIIFTSPPCKGFSGLLSQKNSQSKKYQALNQLTVRGIELCLKAFEEDLPALILLENVPRITSRGIFLLNRIKKLLRKYGYAVSDGYHDCGAIGGLAQHRKRYLLIARHEKKVPAFVYHPPVKPMQTIGDVIGTLPLPDDPIGGKMHKLPRLQEKTWQRLAFIRPGHDWRDLEQAPKGLQLGCKPRSGTYGIIRWNEPAPTVTGSADIHAGTAAVADPRNPEMNEKKLILGKDGTWHRPLTTLELAALQGFPTILNGKPLELAGKNEQRWRERIGNAVPPQAAQAIAETMLRTLMPAKEKEWVMAAEPIWVQPDMRSQYSI
ncbi:DNA cytosine methyltransferase [Thermoactinomyces sp. CICC 10520]|uniref:DNA cytosine methyltransferase n=1 Tax=Thermoactinomyces sp. CICC 10520 TaxID=2767433 RepID=UPI001E4C8F71|nr:DNA cytosine methyltransferase [Thermoactinomyces sp. CICC 10520]